MYLLNNYDVHFTVNLSVDTTARMVVFGTYIIRSTFQINATQSKAHYTN